MKDTPLFLVVDLFCGAGGTSYGFTTAKLNGQSVAKVVACVNHDRTAIRSHQLNHTNTIHFREDIRKLNPSKLAALVTSWRSRYPQAYVIIWASLECTNFSWAKGGRPRNADSRTLANHLFPYIEAIQPHYLMIENVVEFKAWGPLNEQGKPISQQNGRYWLAWRKKIREQYQYIDCWTEMNSANFGALTSRNRLFGLFAKPGLPMIFPEATHSKTPVQNSLFDGLHPWRSVREVLDFSHTGKSIFGRRKPLSDNTLSRLLKGLQRFVGQDQRKPQQFISLYYTNGANYSIDVPLPTITTKDRAALISLTWLQHPPDGFIYNPAWGGHSVSLEQPCCVVVARQDKAPLQLVQMCYGQPPVIELPSDSAICKQIKAFMAEYGIADISLRMLCVDELLQIQGFPRHYKLSGTLTHQKKFIGNAVVPIVVTRWVEALASSILQKKPCEMAA